MTNEEKAMMDGIAGGIDNLNSLCAALLDEAKKQTAFLARLATAPAARPAAARPAASGTTQRTGDSRGHPRPIVFPNFGATKGEPIEGAMPRDLQYYRAAVSRSIGDPAKAQYIDSNRAMIEAIDAEIARQSGTPAEPDWRGAEPAPAGAPAEDDMPF